jgi:hypothetical protein
MKIKALLIVGLLLLADPVFASDPTITNVRWISVRVDNRRTVSQGKFGVGCGYASILNSLAFGSSGDRKVFDSLPDRTNEERIKRLIDTYGSKPSVEHGNNSRNRDTGVAPNDLCDIYNDIRKANGLPALSSSYLSRSSNETQKQLLVRIHVLLAQSLKSEEPPILGLRCEAATWKPSASSVPDTASGQNPMRGQCKWDSIGGHFVTVVGVPEITNDDGSFCLDYIDPADGVKGQMFLYSDVRNFGAWKGVKEHQEFLRERPFPIVASSTLRMHTQEQVWSARTEIYLDHAIYKKALDTEDSAPAIKSDEANRNESGN